MQEPPEEEKQNTHCAGNYYPAVKVHVHTPFQDADSTRVLPGTAPLPDSGFPAGLPPGNRDGKLLFVRTEPDGPGPPAIVLPAAAGPFELAMKGIGSFAAPDQTPRAPNMVESLPR